jgi:hypothetical protein
VTHEHTAVEKRNPLLVKSKAGFLLTKLREAADL